MLGCDVRCFSDVRCFGLVWSVEGLRFGVHGKIWGLGVDGCACCVKVGTL